MVSEAGHYKTFLKLARIYQPKVGVDRRWKEILEGETQILKGFSPRDDRIH